MMVEACHEFGVYGAQQFNSTVSAISSTCTLSSGCIYIYIYVCITTRTGISTGNVPGVVSGTLTCVQREGPKETRKQPKEKAEKLKSNIITEVQSDKQVLAQDPARHVVNTISSREC